MSYVFPEDGLRKNLSFIISFYFVEFKSGQCNCGPKGPDLDSFDFLHCNEYLGYSLRSPIPVESFILWN
jgi:hypothetical protein